MSRSKAPIPPSDSGPAPSSAETLAALHRDIAFANTYRLELIKYLLGICAAIFAFTLSFRPTLETVDAQWSMWLGWLGLGASMLGGMVHMIGWDHYYKSYRDYDYKGQKLEGRQARRKINRWRRVGMAVQYGGFALGVAGVGLFSAFNLDHVRRTASESAGAKSSVASPARAGASQTAASHGLR